MIVYAPIDADGHVMETDDELRRYLPPRYEGRRALTALFPSLDGWPRSTRKSPDTTPCLQKWRMFLDSSRRRRIGALSDYGPGDNPY